MGNSTENTFTDVQVKRVDIASRKHKVSHSASLFILYTSANTSFPFLIRILIFVLASS